MGLAGMSGNCYVCKKPIVGARVRLSYDGFVKSDLNGVTFTCCARCVSLAFPDREIRLPERISDPVAESDLVTVSFDITAGWAADCADHGRVAMKDERDDAHLAAAHHLARVHVGVLA